MPPKVPHRLIHGRCSVIVYEITQLPSTYYVPCSTLASENTSDQDRSVPSPLRVARVWRRDHKLTNNEVNKKNVKVKAMN